MTDSLKILILVALTSVGCGAPEEDAEPEIVVEVRTAKAVVQDVEQTVRVPATVFPR